MRRYAVVHAPILRGEASAIYVARRSETTWFVAGPDFTNEDASCFRRIELAAALELEPTLAELEALPIGHCAYRGEPTEAWSWGIVPVGQTFLVTYDTRPGDTNPERDELGGAIVNCWVVTDSLVSARRIAEEHLAESGWIVIDKVQENHAPAEDYDHDEYFRQAQVDGLVAVFHTYPRDELELN